MRSPIQRVVDLWTLAREAEFCRLQGVTLALLATELSHLVERERVRTVRRSPSIRVLHREQEEDRR